MQYHALATIAALVAAAPAALAQDAAPAAPAAAPTDTFTDGFDVGETHTFSVQIGVRIDQNSGETALPQQLIGHDLRYAITRVGDANAQTYSLDITEGSLGYINGDNRTQLTIPPASDAVENTPAALLSAAVITFTMDGTNVTDISGNERFLAAAEEAGLAPQLVGHFTDDQLAQTIVNILRPAELVGSTRALGASWTVSNSFPVSNVAVFDFNATWTLNTVNDRAAMLTAPVALTLRRPADEDPARPGITLDSHEGMRTLEFNRAEGVTQQFRSTRAMTTTWTLGELSIQQTDESTTVITRTDNSFD